MEKTFRAILLCAVILAGCTQHTEDIPKVTVSPAVLDFGSARIEDSPVSLAFEIDNQSDKPIKILDISSGCGCTVIDISDEPIPPKEKKTIDVKVNLSGRSGEFTNIVRVKTDTNQDLLLDVKGIIVTDIWCNEPSIRCTAASGANEAESVFTLHTKDFADVQFDWSNLPKNMQVQEVSRTTINGICNIQFTLSVSISEQNSLSEQLTVIPKDDRITPLILPVYCYRNDMEQQSNMLSTEQVSLGQVARNDTREIKIFGNPEVLQAVRAVIYKDIPSEIETEILPQSNDAIDVLHIRLTFSDSFPQGFFNGTMSLRAPGNREWNIPINGELIEAARITN